MKSSNDLRLYACAIGRLVRKCGRTVSRIQGDYFIVEKSVYRKIHEVFFLRYSKSLQYSSI